MPEASPPVTIAKPGTIPISAVNNAPKQQPSNVQKDAAARASTAKLKVVLRRLPPGLTQQELEAGLGADWLVGKGRVDWMRFAKGKVSKDPAKPSRPACCYLHLTAQEHLDALASSIQTAIFHDARNTVADPALIGPAIVDFALFQRIPATKKRNDARQGLIDQDPEFIEFLEGLTDPITRPQNVETLLKDEEGHGDDKVTTTPLIQHLRDKKAAKEKAKESKGKAHGRTASKADVETKADAKATPKEDKKSDRSGRRGGKQESQKKESAAASPKPPAASPAKAESKPATPSAKRTVADSPTPTAARLIQRDLGVRGGRGGGQRKQGGRNENKTAPSGNEASDSKASVETNPATSRSSANANANNANANARNKAATAPATPSAVLKRQPAAATANDPAQAAKPATLSNPTGTSAFLKHANPSQGVTESLIQAALSAFGPVKSVEIDKRKGFAYVEFGDSASLAKAIGQGTVKVAQGNVLVLERKERSSASTPSTPAKASAAALAAAATAPAANNGTTAASAANSTSSKPATAPAAMRADASTRGGGGNRFRGGRSGRAGNGGGGRGRGGGGGGGGNQAAQQPAQPASTTSSAPAVPSANASTNKAAT